MATDLDRVADLHFWLISTMSAIVAVSDRTDAASVAGRVADYAARQLLGHGVAGSTDVELQALADCLDEIADAADHLHDVMEQAALAALAMRKTTNHQERSVSVTAAADHRKHLEEQAAYWADRAGNAGLRQGERRTAADMAEMATGALAKLTAKVTR